MYFTSPAEAVSFAEEILNRPVMKTMMQVINTPPGRGGDVDSVRDLAHTISEKLSQIEQDESPTAGKVFRYLFGKGDNEQLIRATMAVSRELLAESESPKGANVDMPDYQLRSLVLAILKQTRQVEQGRGSKSFAWIGRQVGYTDQRMFRRKFRELVSHIRENIERNTQIAEYRLEYRLKEVEILP